MEERFYIRKGFLGSHSLYPYTLHDRKHAWKGVLLKFTSEDEANRTASRWNRSAVNSQGQKKVQSLPELMRKIEAAFAESGGDPSALVRTPEGELIAQGRGNEIPDDKE